MSLTENEVKALAKIVASEYQDGNPVDHAVWTSYCNPFKSKRTFSGVISSLVQKGFVVTGGSSADANRDAGCDGTTLAITQAGYDALQAAQKAAAPQVKRTPRRWDSAILTLAAAQQDAIAEGDIVRSYDFPGSRDDVYIEGVVKGREHDRVIIHVTREVWQGEDEQVGRFEVHAPLGVSSLSGSPCVFLIAKRKERA